LTSGWSGLSHTSVSEAEGCGELEKKYFVKRMAQKEKSALTIPVLYKFLMKYTLMDPGPIK
jgi:hypothetical protein